MTSPYIYIIFSLMICNVVLCVTFYIAWANFGKEAHALTWSFAFLIGAMQFGATLNAHSFPSEMAYLLTENVLSIVLITLGLKGHCQRTQCGWLPQSLWPYAAVVYGATVWYTAIAPHAGIARAISPVYAAITLAMSAYIILSNRERTRPSEWAVATSILLLATAQLVSATISLLQGPVYNEAMFAVFMNFTYLTLPPLYISTAILIILMMASDISAKMKKLAVHDQLTGLLNRRGFSEYGERAFASAKRAGTHLSVIMTDIDRFKYINDKFGHAAGDTALAHFAQLVSENRRSEDVIARVGGEEFALLLPGTSLRDAMALADQLCNKIGETPMDLTGIGLPMTSSFGVASISKKDSALDDMVRRADRALYRSKRAGRNQVDLESSQLMLAEDGTLQPVSSG